MKNEQVLTIMYSRERKGIFSPKCSQNTSLILNSYRTIFIKSSLTGMKRRSVLCFSFFLTFIYILGFLDFALDKQSISKVIQYILIHLYANK